jgi:hypothetical protein
MYDIEKYKKKLHYFDRKFIRKIQAILLIVDHTSQI